jgi:hypothetical protein
MIIDIAILRITQSSTALGTIGALLAVFLFAAFFERQKRVNVPFLNAVLSEPGEELKDALGEGYKRV